MAQQTINIGAVANDGTGDHLRTAGDKINDNFTELYAADVTLTSALAAKAPLASPTFTGVPAAPTAAGGTNTTQIASTAFVTAAVAALINSAPGALDTLDELAAALGDDANFASTVTTALAGKQPLDADLTALAALTTTAYGRSLIEAADAAALRTLAGLVIGTHVQAYDADLAALAALTTTAYGRSLIEAADAAALRTLAGLVIGTHVQAYDAELAALAGLTSAADKLAYFTGSGTAALADLSSVARTLIAQTSQANMRTTGLGLGTSATIDTGTSGTKVALTDGANSWSAAQTFVNASGVKILDTDASHTLGLVGGSNLTANRTLTLTTGDASRSLTFTADATIGGTTSGTNTGDQTSIVGITGSLAEFNTALTGADFATGGGTATGTNTGDQTSIVGITGTLAQFNTAVSDADLAPINNPVLTGVVYYQQGAPTARNSTTTLTIADLLTGIITATSASAVSLTLPTGTLTDGGVVASLANDRMFEWVIINLGSSSGAVTVLAGTGHTIVGNAVVAISTSARFWTRKTATNTFVTYRVG